MTSKESSVSRSSESLFLRTGQEAYEQELKRLQHQQQNQKRGFQRKNSIDPPAALDPDDLPPSPTHTQRPPRSSVLAAAAAPAPANHAVKQIETLNDGPIVGTYSVPTFKDEDEGDDKQINYDLPYTWEDVVKEAERRKSRHNSSSSVSGSSNGGSNQASPLYLKQVRLDDVKGGIQQHQQEEDRRQNFCSDPSILLDNGRRRRRRRSLSTSAKKSPNTPMASALSRRYQPKSNPGTRTQRWGDSPILDSPEIGESKEPYRHMPSALMAPSLPFQNYEQIPSLPLIQTFEATKDNPDQPAGLFLKKAKNGAVIVHSVSPTSIFCDKNDSDKDLITGQEVLSVNEKRVNDPKMAASLISQAKGRLSLRVSSLERQRGFLYCQVKRRLGRGTSKNHHHRDNSNQARDHGIRFVTTNVDGVRRGTVTEGLVRVSHVDPNGLFATLHPLNRLRMGSIILTINGAPVTNGRVALEKVMESRLLIEVLHCDERVWREDWVMDGLVNVVFGDGSGGKLNAKESAFSTLTRKDDAKRHGQYKLLDQYWVLSWNVEHNEVALFKVGTKDCAFKLLFQDEVGTCRCEPIDGKMMPSTDIFDVSSLVKSVNIAQKEMMILLQNMLQRSKLEISTLGWNGLPKQTVLSTAVAGDRLTNADRIKSFEGLEELFNNEQPMKGGAANLTNLTQKACKRRSTGALKDETYEENLYEELEVLHLNKTGVNKPSKENKLREFSVQQHRMEEIDLAKDNRKSGFSIKSANGSMFSADLLEEFVNDLEHDFGSESTESTETHATHSSNESERPPPSPRDIISGTLDESIRTSSETSLDDDKAYITGVWRDVASKYEISDTVLGEGGFGKVKDCYDKGTGKLYVVKMIFKPLPGDTVKINLIRNEILLLHEANHPNIVELKDLFEDDQYVHIVMERCAGGDLFDRVVEENPRRIRSINQGLKHEATTANAMRSIIQVVKYLHSKGICHRDIKPEHFLLTTNERETQKIKLIDFGLARKHDPGSEPMSTFTGSPSFVAPEVIDRSYDHNCDNWSTGVTAYFLLTGMLPFDGRDDEETFQIISRGHFSFPPSSIFLSSDAKDFVAKLLVTDPRRRMTAAEALNHPWLRKAATC